MLKVKPIDTGGITYSPGLQVLRGLAALMIVFLHLGVAEARYGSSGWQYLDGFRVGAAGVDIFFVISGFVMMLVIYNKMISPVLFLKNRLSRIYPNYWIYFLIVVLVWLVQPGWVNSSLSGTPDFLSSFLLFPSSGPPVVSVAWTLEFEIFFYLVFTLFLWVSRQHLAPLLISFFTMLVLLGVIYQPESLLLERLTHPLLLEFSAGILLGRVLISRQIPGAWLAIPVAILLFILYQMGFELTQIIPVGTHLERLANFGIPAVLLVLGFVSLDMKYQIVYPDLFIKIGDASYTLYLSHILIISASGKLYQAFGLNEILSNFVFIVGMLVLCILSALLAYQYLELPLLTYVRKSLKKSSQ
ncbi:MAG: acyltransferase [Candidatus Marinimicrobia bacterium]|jgi:peptidoglycan/LPS O-acetylase OafA/YrhL|nr:acyltransferase [Candidatus Neomarinimicrobiota bacterium]MBT3631185.1 acyltransferase [Candidatus Neomarinimicrobiota bacterium]MBT3824693.1 acyltransferase [Candidatus Neomarinimicrobiota bacterium]MBT4131617.1 acyltransferase [Candidatus Neomarinimicrobiota bacterium]MBT4296086.1 acyltransferase [Candidatus Neomarinimicrobiota bacterium]